MRRIFKIVFTLSKLPGEKTCEYQPSIKLPEPFARNVFKKEHKKLEAITKKTTKKRLNRFTNV